ncbi:MMPL family transporter [Solirubrobacter sp. CPCC 204708]|uniref:MMPL family transporter n=1 Tax=Solirubrobacter deserti TaxID=2282478 RepID=A0ABT4RMA9_9ACTN|nr:MMPL family transporter [Solirubrobacter deserti]MBE2318024.1 MMPL family transporter [Solirubrobacter deserti]MDA0139703.1 MMPL family transporter [Solirubrobacter deserti]
MHSTELLARVTRACAAAAARRPKITVLLWMLLVAGFVTAGAMTGTKSLTGADAGVGESAKADRLLAEANLQGAAQEVVLLRSDDAAKTAAATTQFSQQAEQLKDVKAVKADRQRDEGRTRLVQITLRGDPEDAAEHVDGLIKTVDAVEREHKDVTVQAAGQGTTDKAIGEVVTRDLRTAELFSLPVTLIILFLAFGALVAAAVPLMLGLTSVIAAMGGMALISQLTPIDEATSSLVVLLGLAVGVDYSLFYIRREREERRQGRDEHAALNATAATVGRAIVVSGVTVIAGLAGLLLTGITLFASMALATMLVVAIAVLGSLTVLPAVLALLGDRINKGRLPFMPRTGGTSRTWTALANLTTRHPRTSLAIAAALLIALAAPVLGLKTSGTVPSLPTDEPAMVAARAVEQAFPGTPESASLVVTKPAEAERVAAMVGDEAEITRGDGAALITVPLRDESMVERLREQLPDYVYVTGEAANKLDFQNRLETTTPLVIAFVLALAMILLLTSFRSVPLALTIVGLNLLSVGAAYGVLTAIFQNTWAEDALGFTSHGAIVDWVPLNTFVILFGLSMDYTILVLERIREARRNGNSPRAAAAEGVSATAGAITSAAVVMVAIFAIFPTLPLIEMKMMGVALAIGVLLDATLVRGIALPAAVALLGERGVRARGASSHAASQLGVAPTNSPRHRPLGDA